MTRSLYYLITAIFLASIFSPFVQTSEEPEIIPIENIDLVDIRLQLVNQNPEIYTNWKNGKDPRFPGGENTKSSN